jgi:hypothetical protein
MSLTIRTQSCPSVLQPERGVRYGGVVIICLSERCPCPTSGAAVQWWRDSLA